MEVEMPGGKGITVPMPLTDPADFESRVPRKIDVKDKLSHVIKSVERIKEVKYSDYCTAVGHYRWPPSHLGQRPRAHETTSSILSMGSSRTFAATCDKGRFPST